QLGAEMRFELRDVAASGCDRRVEATSRGGETAGLGHREHDRHGLQAIHRSSFPLGGTMDSVFAPYARLLKELRSSPRPKRHDINTHPPGAATNLKETEMWKTRNCVMTAAALRAMGGTIAHAGTKGAAKDIVIVHAALGDASGWRAVHDILSKDGF